MKHISIIIIFIFLSCNNQVTINDVQKLNGYWDISKVVDTDNKVTEYKINSTIDYYFINKKNKGFRKKTTLDLSGKYKTNNLKDSISVEKKNGNIIIKTTTALNNWEDTIVKITPDELVLKNEAGVLFYYKKHQKIKFE